MSEDFHPEDVRPQNFGPHLFMGVIILILVLALIVLTFIPKGIRIEGGPQIKGYNSSPNQQTSTKNPSSLTASSLLVIPPLSLSRMLPAS